MLINVGRGAPKLTGNATPADVIAGKTFYSSDAKVKLIGNMNIKALVKYASGSGTITPLSIAGTESISAYGLGFMPILIFVAHAEAPDQAENSTSIYYEGREGIGPKPTYPLFINVGYGTFTWRLPGYAINRTYNVRWETFGR